MPTDPILPRPYFDGKVTTIHRIFSVVNFDHLILSLTPVLELLNRVRLHIYSLSVRLFTAGFARDGIHAFVAGPLILTQRD